MVSDEAVPVVAHWVDGRLHAGSSTRTGDVFDPATGRVAKLVAFASTDDVDVAVAAASAAFTQWRATSLTERTKVLFRFRELLHQRTDELAAIITARARQGARATRAARWRAGSRSSSSRAASRNC